MTEIDKARTALLAVWSSFLSAPTNPYQSRKIIHDPIWGTARYEPWEAALLDLPLFQRLRGLKQTGFAHFTYPAAEHSRFQHTLGVVHAAGKIFGSILERRTEDGLSKRAKAKGFGKNPILNESSTRYRHLIRLAALVHDLGHSFYSHTSERIYGLVPPFPSLTALLTPTGGKAPGAAEVVVYLLVTSDLWRERFAEIWTSTGGAEKGPPPTKDEWERIGRWAMGQESDPEKKFLADIISGPLDADKLDYISRDAYFAGVPVGYDLERFTATVCVDPQNDRYRLTIPLKGINALEQLVMGRLVLNSYLYHHQKARAAEVAFERLLVREYLDKKKLLGIDPPWNLFGMEDADVYCRTKDGPGLDQYKQLLRRYLPVKVIEIKGGVVKDTESGSAVLTGLLSHSAIETLDKYRRLLELEDDLATYCAAPKGSLIVDVPKPPKYKELEDLQLPDDSSGEPVSPDQVLNYTKWIAGYETFRPFIRVFATRSQFSDNLGTKVLSWFASKGLDLPDTVVRRH
jgi:HD superfamily phosphohydrolase